MVKKPKYSALEESSTGSATRTIPIPARRFIDAEEYYCRWGYLPPGYSLEIAGNIVCHGGGEKWRGHAKSLKYPDEPSPHEPQHRHDKWKRFLDKVNRPWLNDDYEITTPLYPSDWNAEDYQRRKREISKLRRTPVEFDQSYSSLSNDPLDDPL
jgi:hypothetical protein